MEIGIPSSKRRIEYQLLQLLGQQTALLIISRQ